VAVVVGPAPEDWVEPMDQRFPREVRCGASGQLLDPVHDLRQRSFAWEAVGDRRSTGARATHDAKPEQVEAVVDVGDVRFLGRERQAQLLAHTLGRLLLERLRLGLAASYQHDEVVRVADHSVAGEALGPVADALVCRPRRPGRLDVAVEHREGDVRKQR
jgi:hypothetical protein